MRRGTKSCVRNGKSTISRSCKLLESIIVAMCDYRLLRWLVSSISDSRIYSYGHRIRIFPRLIFYDQSKHFGRHVD
jgi:hypothetical protein